MTAEMVAPAWMHEQITAEEYDSWSEEQCAGIEIVDGMVVVSPSASKRHARLARLLANALDAAAGPDWNADTDFDVRLQDVPLTNRRPDVVVYRKAIGNPEIAQMIINVEHAVGGDLIQQYGAGSIGKAEHTGSGDIVAGGKNVGVAEAGPALRALLAEVERLRPHLDAADRAEVDAAAGAIAEETSAERRRTLVQRISGIAALVGEVGLPVVAAGKALLSG